MKRSLLLAIPLSLAAACATQKVEPSPVILSQGIRFFGQFLMTPPPQHPEWRFGEVSGAVVKDPAQGQFLLVSDDAGEEGLTARYFEAHIEHQPHQRFKFEVQSMTQLSVEPGSVDLEAMAYDPQSQHYFLSSEGEPRLRESRDVRVRAKDRASLLEIDKQGHVVNRYAFPSNFAALYDLKSEKQIRGLKPNKGFEAMTIVQDSQDLEKKLGPQIAVIAEQPLAQEKSATRLPFEIFRIQDGQLSSTAHLIYSLSDKKTTPELGFESKVSDLGVSEMLSLGQGRFWVLERGFYANEASGHFKNTAQVFEIDLTKKKSVVLEKRLILDFDSLLPVLAPAPKGVRHVIDNVEALALYRNPSDGQAWLLAFTDDNLSPRQRGLVYVFSIPDTLL